MAPIVSENILQVRAGWSDQERRERKARAGAMQLQLRALVVLSALAADDAAAEQQETVAVASAC
ncbi:MAG: hypothetical protein P8L85_16130 [Rubripirellula sp.]|nr:hypothetical protein [Rubripirellula sp.]